MSHYNPWGQTFARPAAPPAAPPAVDPALAFLSPAAAISQMTGLGRTQVGQDAYGGAPLAGAGIVVGVALVGITAVLSYYAGAAMTPSGSKRKTWGIVGIPVGMLTGAWGLGVMGIVASK